MKKDAACVFLFTGVIMGWANTVSALNVGANTQIGITQFLLLIVCHIIFLFVASKIVSIEVPDFWRAVSCSLGIAAVFFLILVFSGGNKLPGIGLIAVAIVDIVLIQRVYNTTLGRTLGAFLLSMIATVIAAKVLSGIL